MSADEDGRSEDSASPQPLIRLQHSGPPAGKDLIVLSLPAPTDPIVLSLPSLPDIDPKVQRGSFWASFVSEPG